MRTVIQGYLGKVKVGRKQSRRNLAVFPLLSGYTTALDYMTRDEALAGGLIEVTEVSEGGAVPELKVVNKSPRMVLILDGEELVGAKQNRIVNTTILSQAKATSASYLADPWETMFANACHSLSLSSQTAAFCGALPRRFVRRSAIPLSRRSTGQIRPACGGLLLSDRKFDAAPHVMPFCNRRARALRCYVNRPSWRVGI